MKPIIGMVCDTYVKGPHLYHSAGHKYVDAVVRVADCIPFLIPAIDGQMHPRHFLEHVDGLLLTGGYANIQRHHYGLSHAPKGEIEDPRRDAQNLAMIPAALDMGLPMFGICRGFQELNVALGGTLHPLLHEVDGRIDHRENPDDPVEVQYGPAHSVTVAAGGMLHSIVNETEFMVNTVHGQGVDRLADDLVLEAEADDGTAEAVSVANASGFALAVQWHPEWQAHKNPQSTRLFQSFGKAARQWQAQHRNV